MSIPRFSNDASPQDVLGAIADAGCAVVTDLVNPAQRESIKQELAPHLSKAAIEDDDPDAFYPGITRRITALATRSPTITDELLMHPMSKAVYEGHLSENARYGCQLHVSAALEVGPGARKQILHREEDPFDFFPVPRPNLIVASMWAISDFRADNGATLIVPGSHRWPAHREPEPAEVVNAEMPAGSVLYWAGGLLHGAGENRSQDWRYGVILTYSLGWVRQEENQYLDVPKARLDELAPEVRKLLGFDMYGGSLGFYDPTLA